MVHLGLGDLLSRPAAVAVLTLGLLLGGNGPAAGQTTGPAPGIAIIANPDVPVPPDGMTAADVRRIFMLRRLYWQDGLRVAPVNLPAADPLRLRFSRLFLGQSPRELVGYWNDLYFHGQEPPPVVESQRAVLLYVARTPGAIGYVPAELVASPPAGIRVVPVRR